MNINMKRRGPPDGHAAYNVNGEGGRPLEYTEEEIENQANDLLQWSLGDDALRLYGFVDKKPYAYSKLAEFAKKNIRFREALEKAKNRIADRREDLANHGMIASHVYNRTHHIYDSAAVETEDESKDKQLERDLKKLEKEIELKAAKGIATDEEIEYLNSSFGIVDQLQALLSKRKISDNNINADAKS